MSGQVISNIPMPGPNDFASRLMDTLHRQSVVTWSSVVSLAETDSSGNYLFRCFGTLHLNELQRRLKEADFLEKYSECEKSYANVAEIVEEIRKNYMPALLSRGAIRLIENSKLSKINGFRSHGVRMAAIVFGLQYYLRMEPLSLPYAYSLKLHQITLLPDEPENMLMSTFLSSREKKRIAHKAFIHAIFSPANPGTLALSCSQWCDIGLTLVQNGALPEKSDLTLLKEWAEWEEVTSIAKSSVDDLLDRLFVDSLLFKGSCEHRSDRHVIPYTRHPQCVLTPQTSFPAWEERQVFAFLLRSFLGIPPKDVSSKLLNDFIDRYRISQPTSRSIAVFFAKKINKKYAKWRSGSNEKISFSETVKTLDTLLQRLNNLIDAHQDEKLSRLLHAALLTAQSRVFFHFSLEQLMDCFHKYYSLKDVQRVYHAWKEPVEQVSTSIATITPSVLLKYADFTAEEYGELFVACCHYKMQLRRAVLNHETSGQRPLTLLEAFDSLDMIERYINAKLPHDVVFSLLRLQCLTHVSMIYLKSMEPIRNQFRTSKKLFDVEFQKLIRAQLDLRQLKFIFPPYWDERHKSAAQKALSTFHNMLQYSTALYGDAQEEYVRFVSGLITYEKIYEPNGKWCSFFRGMVRELAPHYRAIWVEGQWIKDNIFQLHVKWMLSLAKPMIRQVCVELMLSRAELAQDRELMDLLPGLLRVLCDETLPERQIQWELEGAPDEFQLKHLGDLLYIFSKKGGDRKIKEEIYPRYQKYCERLDSIRIKHLNEIIQFAFRLKIAMRQQVIDICDPVLSSVAESEKCRIAARGDIWPASDQGLSLLPSNESMPLNEFFGIQRVDYLAILEHAVKCCKSAKPFTLLDKCRIQVILNRERVDLPVTIAGKVDIYENEDCLTDTCINVVTMSIPDRPHMTLTEKYPQDFSPEILLEMLFCQLAQLKGLCYGHARSQETGVGRQE